MMDTQYCLLIVDDEPVNRAILVNLFRDSCRLLEAEDGIKAHELLLAEGEKIDLVLLDLRMPRLDGFSLLSLMQQDDRLSRIPVFVVTAADDPKSELRALELNAADFVTKPFEPQCVRVRVQNILSRQEALRLRRENAELAERESQRAMLDHVPGGFAVFEVEGGTLKMLSSNDFLYTLLGAERSVLEPSFARDASSAIHPDDFEVLKRRYREGAELPLGMMVRLRRADNTLLPCMLSVRSEPQADGKSCYFVLFIDATREQRYRDELKYRAEFDSLTGIYNKESFFAEANELLAAEAEELTLVRFNISRFKLINELFGHETGDKILIRFAKALTELIPFGSVCGRLSGDNFACVCESAKLDIASLLLKITESVHTESAHGIIVICAGIYTITDRRVPIDQMCDRAALALEAVKNRYKSDYAYYDDSLRRALLEEQAMRDELEQALSEGQFQMYLQPVFAARERSIISAEALARWVHPQKGVLSPGSFIPLFEKSGFVSRLDFCIWEQACRYLRDRRERGEALLPISVNMSRLSLYHFDLSETLLSIAQSYGIEPKYLRVEITETSYSDNPAQLLETTEKLHQCGFSVLMDDFGSGYSSLNSLKDIPIDTLKVDMKFLEKLEESEKSGVIFTSIIRMAKWLRLPVIAEGAETQSNVEFLRSIGCSMVQGYYYARPMNVEDFDRFCRDASLADLEIVSPESRRGLNDAYMIFSGSDTVNRLLNASFGALAVYEYTPERLELVRMNDRYVAMTGYSDDPNLPDSRNAYHYDYPPDIPLEQAACREAIISRGSVRRVIRRLHNRDSHIMWLDCIYTYIEGTEERALLCIAFNDITPSVLAEDYISELKQENSRISSHIDAIIANIPGGAGIFEIADGNAHALLANDGFYSLFGCRDAADYFAAHRSGASPLNNLDMEKISSIAAVGGDMDMEFCCARIDGSEIWLHMSASPVDYPLSPHPVYAAVFVDVTGSRELSAQGEHARVQQQYTKALMQLYSEVFEINLERQSVRLLFSKFNSRLVVGDEYPLKQAIGVWLGFVAAEDRSRVENFFTRDIYDLAAAGGASRFEYGVRTGQLLRRIRASVLSMSASSVLIGNSALPDSSPEYIYTHCYRLAAEQLGVVVIDWDEHFGSLYRSPALSDYELGKLSSSELLSHRVGRQCVHPDDYAVFSRFFAGLSENPAPYCELRLKMRDGSYQKSRISVAIMRDEQGEILRMLLVIINIEEYERSSRLLKRDNDRFELLAEALPLGVGIFRYDIGSKLEMVYVTPTLCRLFSDSEDKTELTDANLSEVKKAADVGFVTRLGEAFECVTTMKTDSGEPISVRAIGSFAHEGESMLCYLALDNVTESIEAEREHDWDGIMNKFLLEMSDAVIYDYDVASDNLNVSLPQAGQSRRSIELPHYLSGGGSPYLTPEHYKMLSTTILNMTNSAQSAQLEFLADYDGSGLQWYRNRLRPVCDSDGKVFSVIGHAQNITHQKELERTARREKSYFEAVISRGLAALDVDMQTKNVTLLSCDEARRDEFYDWQDYLSAGNLASDDLLLFDSDADVLAWDNILYNYSHGVRYLVFQFKLKKRDGSYVWATANVNMAETPESGTRAIIYVEEIDERKRLEEELRIKAEYDAVTALYNRVTTEEMISAVLSSPSEQESAFVIFDIDHFKQINDTYGHPTGDIILRRVASAVRDTSRRDDVLGRIGGDEFVILLKNIGSAENAKRRVTQFMGDVREIGRELSLEIPTSISAGIAMRKPGDKVFRDLFTRADIALYRAKNGGRNRTVVYEEECQSDSGDPSDR